MTVPMPVPIDAGFRLINGMADGLLLADCSFSQKAIPVNGDSPTSATFNKQLDPLLQRDIHVRFPLILWCLRIHAQVMEEQWLITQFFATGRQPIAVDRIDRFADVVR